MNDITIKVTDEALTSAISTTVAFLLGGALTWLFGIPSRRKAKRREAEEHEARLKAEAELAEIENRGDAPHYFPSKQRFGHLYLNGDKPGAVESLTAYRHPQLLCFAREEVERDLPEGTLVYLVLSNAGRTAKTIRMDIDGERIAYGFEPNINDAEGKEFIAYSYKPSIHGKFQVLTARFEMPSGRQPCHKYGMWHGTAKLVRIDPQ